MKVCCTLSAGDFQVRRAWIAGLNQVALLHYRRDDLRLEFVYAAESREQVAEHIILFDHRRLQAKLARKREDLGTIDHAGDQVGGTQMRQRVASLGHGSEG